jgi:hypothetical protein
MYRSVAVLFGLEGHAEESVEVAGAIEIAATEDEKIKVGQHP